MTVERDSRQGDARDKESSLSRCRFNPPSGHHRQSMADVCSGRAGSTRLTLFQLKRLGLTERPWIGRKLALRSVCVMTQESGSCDRKKRLQRAKSASRRSSDRKATCDTWKLSGRNSPGGSRVAKRRACIQCNSNIPKRRENSPRCRHLFRHGRSHATLQRQAGQLPRSGHGAKGRAEYVRENNNRFKWYE